MGCFSSCLARNGKDISDVLRLRCRRTPPALCAPFDTAAFIFDLLPLDSSVTFRLSSCDQYPLSSVIMMIRRVLPVFSAWGLLLLLLASPAVRAAVADDSDVVSNEETKTPTAKAALQTSWHITGAGFHRTLVIRAVWVGGALANAGQPGIPGPSFARRADSGAGGVRFDVDLPESLFLDAAQMPGAASVRVTPTGMEGDDPRVHLREAPSGSFVVSVLPADGADAAAAAATALYDLEAPSFSAAATAVTRATIVVAHADVARPRWVYATAAIEVSLPLHLRYDPAAAHGGFRMHCLLPRSDKLRVRCAQCPKSEPTPAPRREMNDVDAESPCVSIPVPSIWWLPTVYRVTMGSVVTGCFAFIAWLAVD